MRYGMVIDVKRCVGCQACTIACIQKNGNMPNVYYSKVKISEEGRFPNTTLHYLPILCNHCEEPSCAKVCPVGATKKEANGMVTIDAKKCIGCRYCMTACPYNARVYVRDNKKAYFGEKGLTAYENALYSQHQVGTVEKCTFCQDLVEKGLPPACVQTCVGQARIFGDLDDLTSEAARLLAGKGAQALKPEVGTKPKVYYIGNREKVKN